MDLFASFFAIPVLFILALAWVFFRGRRRAAMEGAGFLLAAMLAGAWSIRQSRASTAGIGFLFLPMFATIVGALGLAGGYWRVSSRRLPRILGWTSFAAGVVLIGWLVVSGIQTIALNRRRDREQTLRSAAITRDHKLVALALKENRGRESAWLDSAIEANMNDQNFILAALESDSVSPRVLDRLATSKDLGIAFEAVRHPNTSTETLDRVYRTKPYPEYFFQPLAAHRHTSPATLRDLYRHQRTMTGLDIWLAGNPATPNDLLLEIAGKSYDQSVIDALLKNPSFDCHALRQLEAKAVSQRGDTAAHTKGARLSKLASFCKFPETSAGLPN